MEKLTENFEVGKFENKYGYKFSDPVLLCQALTHTSFANEYFQKTGEHILHNERFEFLGDTVMGTIISTRIFKRFPDFPEGKLSKMRSAIVCESSLADCFVENGLCEFLQLGKGEEMTGGRERPSILSDCFEAIIGAIYIDGGFKAAEDYIDRTMSSVIESGIKGYDMSDAKTLLQESARKIGNCMPEYELVKAEGPDHDKTFTVKVRIQASEDTDKQAVCNLFGEGTGQSKKEAEQNAALDLLEKGLLKG